MKSKHIPLEFVVLPILVTFQAFITATNGWRKIKNLKEHPDVDEIANFRDDGVQQTELRRVSGFKHRQGRVSFEIESGV